MKWLNFFKNQSFVFAISLGIVIAALGSCNDDDDDDDDGDVAVTGVTLDSTSLSLAIDSTVTLTATVSPSNATEDSVTWSSSDEDVATVSEGTVTGIAEGSATLTVTTVDGSYTATCSVTVSTTGTSSAYSQSSGEVSVSGNTYTATGVDENAVKVSGGTFTMTNCTVVKSGGDTEDTDGSSFYGTNAAILATTDSDTGIVVMNGGTITTDATGANGIVAYGGQVTVSDVTIECSQDLSRGIHATGGGSITASDLTITTEGDNSSVIATDRGGGSITVTGGTYNCSGSDCAVLYSTGDITANNITGTSEIGEIGAIEGDNSITINDCDLTSGAGSSSRGLFLYQSFSGDAEGTNSAINVTGGTLTLTGDETPFIEVATVVTGTVTLNSVTTTIPSGILMLVDYNDRWETYGATGVLILQGDATTYSGDIIVDTASNAEVNVESGVTWEGAYDYENTGVSTTLTIEGGTWELTGDSYVDTITLEDGAVINKNEYSLTYTTLNNTSGTIND